MFQSNSRTQKRLEIILRCSDFLMVLKETVLNLETRLSQISRSKNNQNLKKLLKSINLSTKKFLRPLRDLKWWSINLKTLISSKNHLNWIMVMLKVLNQMRSKLLMTLQLSKTKLLKNKFKTIKCQLILRSLLSRSQKKVSLILRKILIRKKNPWFKFTLHLKILIWMLKPNLTRSFQKKNLSQRILRSKKSPWLSQTCPLTRKNKIISSTLTKFSNQMWTNKPKTIWLIWWTWAFQISN